IVLKNDFVYGGYNNSEGERLEGDKLYAATGIGWDDAALGWHHCPPGMGIYTAVYLEYRNKTHIHDLFVRPIPSENRAEAWIEVENTEYVKKDVSFLLSVYGQNFKETVFEKQLFSPETVYLAGMGDSLTQAEVKDIMGKGMDMPAQKGTNLYKFSFPLENVKLWEPDTPYLYQLQAELVYQDEVTDVRAVQFGMREFRQDTDSEPKGMFYLNGRKIRLRGANTMGFEQLDVMRGDFDQLIDDILLAKICNMNFWRITQRPVQDEVYQYCDRLGFMVQTDLPLFGCMRRNKVAEGIRQAEEMERLIRSHAACVVVSYINEPFPNAKNEPHRHLERPELEQFFASCDSIVRLQNPDRVIKHVDGDYDPPTDGMPDNHCYPTWYNGHGIDIGRLHKGYWLQVKPGWYYGCGEFGTEGLECSEVMRKYYPKEWLAEPFDPGNIVQAQTKDLHRFFYDTQDSLEDWIAHSQRYQAFATRLMAEAFRRDSRMISHAIHLFIDAWPSGWMKTIMDCDRNPKEAYFAYKNALEPMLVSLRTDRFTYFAGEEVSIEVFVCNDTNLSGDDYTMRYELYAGDIMILSGEDRAVLANCDVSAVSDVRFTIPAVDDRQMFTLKAILCDAAGQVLSHNSLAVEVFAPVEVQSNDMVELITDLDVGVHEIAGETVSVKECGMLPLHFVSRKTGHAIVAEFQERDFSYWYNKNEDMITPLLYKTFTAEGFTPILTSGNKDKTGAWGEAFAAAAKEYGGKLYVICLTELRTENPVAKRFLNNIYQYAEKRVQK
ncbi:MAG: glycoside hydrolase family 2 TIM barrel-domain containing protein, partial [Clostridia bacterium]